VNTPATETQSSTLLYLNKTDVQQLSGDSARLYVDAVTHALSLHAQRDFVQPLKPYLRWHGPAGHIADRIIAMPAYIGGETPVAGIKWIGSKHDNPARHNRARASAVIVLNDPETHYPVAIMEGSIISAMRTAAVTTVAAQHLARANFAQVSCIGCGPIGHMQLVTLLEYFPAVAQVTLYDLQPSQSASLAATLGERFPSVRFTMAASAEQAVRAGEVLITATVADKPYIPFSWLRPGAFVSNVSIMDVEPEVFCKADKVVVDDWDQCNREKKVIHQLVQAGQFSREQLHAELGEIVIGARPGRESETEIILLNPMGMAVEDVACAQALYHYAARVGIGTILSLD
jgi:ornithine cyclodeaminase